MAQVDFDHALLLAISDPVLDIFAASDPFGIASETEANAVGYRALARAIGSNNQIQALTRIHLAVVMWKKVVHPERSHSMSVLKLRVMTRLLDKRMLANFNVKFT
jgi:hypothetical protein